MTASPSDAPPGRRRQARERAIGFLYEAETKGVHPAEVLAELPVPPDPFAVRVVEGVGDHRHQLDHLLDEIAAPKWRVDRMAAMDRAVLRLGVYELAYEPDIPEGVVLSEAADLATRYSTDESPKFVNGVLARAATLLRDEDVWPQPTALLLDCDGLIRHWTAEDVEEREVELGLEPGSLAAAAFEKELMGRAMTGGLTAEEWSEEIARRVVPDADDERHRRIAAAWTMANWDVDDAFVELVRQVKEAGEVRIGMYSNASTRLEEDLATMGVVELFEVIVNSSRIGVAKPDVAGFEKAVQMLDTPAERVLFVDDREDNVEGALDAGLQAVHHGGDAARFGAILRRLGLLDG